MRLALFLLCAATSSVASAQTAADETPVPSPPAESVPASSNDPRSSDADRVPALTPPNVAVLSIGGDAGGATNAEARAAVIELLRGDGLAPVPDADIAMRISPSQLRACREAACAISLGRELGVNMISAVTAWTEEGRPSSVTVSLILGRDRSYSATEPVVDTVANAARAAARSVQNARQRALLVEGVTAPPSLLEEPDEEPSPASDDETRLSRDRSLEEWVLPTLLGIVGLGLIGGSVYAMLDTICERNAPISGDCLAGTRPNYGLGAVLVTTGGLSLIGAAIWLIVGGSPPDVGRIDVVLGPDGGTATWGGRF